MPKIDPKNRDFWILILIQIFEIFKSRFWSRFWSRFLRFFDLPWKISWGPKISDFHGKFLGLDESLKILKSQKINFFEIMKKLERFFTIMKLLKSIRIYSSLFDTKHPKNAKIHFLLLLHQEFLTLLILVYWRNTYIGLQNNVKFFNKNPMTL